MFPERETAKLVEPLGLRNECDETGDRQDESGEEQRAVLRLRYRASNCEHDERRGCESCQRHAFNTTSEQPGVASQGVGARSQQRRDVWTARGFFHSSDYGLP